MQRNWLGGWRLLVMNFKRIVAVPRHPVFGDVALLLLRVVAGAAFMFHGWPKIKDPFSWMRADPYPGPLQAVAALSEFGGGLLWILGLLTPLGCLGIGCTMAVATFRHAIVRGDAFVAAKAGDPSFELAAVFLSVALVLLAMGPGRFSADRALFGTR